MAKRQKSSGLFSNKYLMYGLYAAIAYYGYQWWMNRPVTTTAVVTVPPGTGV